MSETLRYQSWAFTALVPADAHETTSIDVVWMSQCVKQAAWLFSKEENEQNQISGFVRFKQAADEREARARMILWFPESVTVKPLRRPLVEAIRIFASEPESERGPFFVNIKNMGIFRRLGRKDRALAKAHSILTLVKQAQEDLRQECLDKLSQKANTGKKALLPERTRNADYPRRSLFPLFNITVPSHKPAFRVYSVRKNPL